MEGYDQFREELRRLRNQIDAGLWEVGCILLDAIGPDGDTAFERSIPEIADDTGHDAANLYTARKVVRHLRVWYQQQGVKPPFNICRRAVQHDAGSAAELMNEWIAIGRPKYAEWSEYLTTRKKTLSASEEKNKRKLAVRNARKFISAIKSAAEVAEFDARYVPLSLVEEAYGQLETLTRRRRGLWNSLRSKTRRATAQPQQALASQPDRQLETTPEQRLQLVG